MKFCSKSYRLEQRLPCLVIFVSLNSSVFDKGERFESDAYALAWWINSSEYQLAKVHITCCDPSYSTELQSLPGYNICICSCFSHIIFL